MRALSFFGRGRRSSFALLPLLLLGCRSEVAKVGDVSVSEEDLSRRTQVSELYFPGSGQRYVALAQLLKGYLSVEVLKSLGHPVDDAILQGEAQRIDQETQAPELLEKIKGIYQGDQKLYLQSFVRGGLCGAVPLSRGLSPLPGDPSGLSPEGGRSPESCPSFPLLLLPGSPERKGRRR